MSFMNGKKFLNVEEATDILLNHDFSDAQLVMLPPPGGDDVLTDEEDINDEHVLEDPYAAPRDVVGEVEVHLKSTEDLEVDYQLHVNATEEQDDNRLDDEESDVDDEGVGDVSNEEISFTIDNPSTSGKRPISTITAPTPKRSKKVAAAGKGRKSTSTKKNVKKSGKTSGKQKETIPKWKKTEKLRKLHEGTIIPNLLDEHPELIAMHASEFFNLFFTESYLEKIVSFTNIYALQRGFTLNTDIEEMKKFFGILIISGYHGLPGEDHYWSTAPDLGCDAVSGTLSRQRFRCLKKYLHFVDNQDLEKDDKYSKIRPVYDELNRQLLQFGIFSRDLSIDESMVPYYGNHSGKMFIKNKPVRFGYKIWAICSSNGYPYQLQLYEGKKDKKIEGVGQQVLA